MNYFITGTDTGVGKTVLSLILMQFLFEEAKDNKSKNKKNNLNLNPFYFKPFQTGCDEDPLGDAGFVYKYTKELQGKNPRDSMLYAFKAPLAPFFAGRREGLIIQEEIFDRKIQELKENFNPLVIEGAGGLLVPITSDKSVLDFMKRVPDLKTFLVARTGLGTINHTLLSLSTLKNQGLDIGGVFMMDSPVKGELEVKKEDLEENIEAIESFSSCKVLGVIPRLLNFENLSSLFPKTLFTL